MTPRTIFKYNINIAVQKWFKTLLNSHHHKFGVHVGSENSSLRYHPFVEPSRDGLYTLQVILTQM